jgi:hypothetical protein
MVEMGGVCESLDSYTSASESVWMRYLRLCRIEGFSSDAAGDSDEGL